MSHIQLPKKNRTLYLQACDQESQHKIWFSLHWTKHRSLMKYRVFQFVRQWLHF